MSGIPFRAALFDLDGTLLDSMYVWSRVDEIFFAKRCMAIPEDYGRALAGKSYRESAQYTVENYLPGEDWRDVIAEWTRLSEIEYAEHVPLKPGALSYLRMLKRAGVKLAVTTALPPKLFRPCLEHLGVLELFDALCSTEHTDGRGKATGEVYLLAAQQLKVAPAECAVFEDVLTGIEGAKKAGMRAYCVRDAHSVKDFAAMEAIADGMIDDWTEMQRYHEFVPARRCVVFTARCDGNPADAYAPMENDFVLCADGGWKYARMLGVKPDLVIGDFDSSEAPSDEKTETHPVMKDDTDTMLCLKYGLNHGCEEFLFIGGFGGRLDHTIANLQTLHYAAKHSAKAIMDDGLTRATILRNGKIEIPKRPGKLSIFSLTNESSGITTQGALYNLTDGTLTNAFPLGVSNEYAADKVTIEVKQGTLLILQNEE